MLCPRWDSNCIPAPANTGVPRKHAESDPIRPQYDPVRGPKCVLCTHLKIGRSAQPATPTALPAEETRFVFALATVGRRTGSRRPTFWVMSPARDGAPNDRQNHPTMNNFMWLHLLHPSHELFDTHPHDQAKNGHAAIRLRTRTGVSCIGGVLQAGTRSHVWEAPSWLAVLDQRQRDDTLGR
jgi:hypothetical protein